VTSRLGVNVDGTSELGLRLLLGLNGSTELHQLRRDLLVRVLQNVDELARVSAVELSEESMCNTLFESR
jgi:hypothetical protein